MRSSGTHCRGLLLCTLLALLAGCTTDGAQDTAGQVLVVDDQFDGTSLDRALWSTCHWWAPDGCTIASNDEFEWYVAEQVAVKDGQLELTAAEAADPQGPDSLPYVSGMVTTGPQASDGPAKLAFTYGRVEVTFDAPSGRGLWPAVWMLPADTESRPEIDLYEATGQQLDTWVFHLHPEDRTQDSKKKELTDEKLGSGFHTIHLDWQPSRLTWSVDGQAVWTVTGRDVPSEPMYLVINLAVGGVFPGPPDGWTPLPRHTRGRPSPGLAACWIMTGGRTASAARLREHLADPMHRDGYALIAGTAITTGLGMLFWIVAARRFHPDDVGVAAVLISSMGFLANLATLGLRNSLIRFLPRSSDPAGLIWHAYLWCGLAAILAAAVFLLGLPIWAPDLMLLRASPGPAVCFIAATAVWLLFVLQDAVLTGIREARWVPLENGLYAVGKLLMLLAFTATSAWVILVAWVTPAALLIIPVNVAVFRALARRRAGSEPTRLGPMVRFAATDHAVFLLGTATSELVPLVLLTTAGAAAGATYFMALTISYTLYLITSNVSSALVVEASLNPETLSASLRRATQQAGMLVAPGALVAMALAPWILALLGPHYVESGTGLLRLMLISAVPNVVVGIAIARARVRKRLRMMVLVNAAISVTVFSTALFAVPQFGLVAMGWASLGIQSLLAVLLAPTVFGAGRSYSATLLGWASAIRSAPHRNRRVRASKELVRSVLREAGLDARSDARLLSFESDVLVCATRADSQELVVRVAATPSGDRTIERLAGILEQLARDPRTRDWDHAPRLVALVRLNDRRASIETLCPGLPADRLSGAARVEAMAAAFEVISEVHQATRSLTTLDLAWCKRHIDDPIGVIERALGTRAPTARLESLRVALRGALADRTVNACTVHGDLWAGNVLVAGSRGAVPTISLIDWEYSVDDGLPEVDMAHAWLAEEPGEIGPVVRLVLQQTVAWPGSRHLDGVVVAGDSDLPVRVIVLMAWLRHVSGQLFRTTELKPTQRWMRANVLTVLEGVADSGGKWPCRTAKLSIGRRTTRGGTES